jgi:hypothetical protein
MAQPAISEVPLPVEAERPTVLYVMGAGRSGSTILGVALGNCENVFFAGFWSAVREQVGDASDLFGGKTTSLERSSALLDIRKWPMRRRLRRRYRRVSEDLYLAIASATGVSNIVDSSHYPLRARELRSLQGIDLHLLFLVRDPQSVVASLGREDVPERRFGVLKANAYIWLTYALSLFVFLGHPRDRRMFVRHEDFVADPEGVLRQILRRSDSSALPPDMSALRTGVPFHGNRLVKSDVVALGAPGARPVRTSRVTAVLQLPWVAVFSLLRRFF